MPEWVQIGEVLREHGVRGAVKVQLYSGNDEHLEEGKTVRLLSKNGQEVLTRLISTRPMMDIFLSQMDAFSNPEEAKLWRGAGLYIPKDELKPVEGDDNAYLFEIVGFDLCDDKGVLLGKIERFEGDDRRLFLVVVTLTGEFLVPLETSWIIRIDKEAKTVRMNLPEGLLE